MQEIKLNKTIDNNNFLYRFSIQHHIQNDGKKNIYKAFDKKLNKFVALELKDFSKLTYNDFYSIIRAAKINSSLCHNNIVEVLDYGRIDKFVYVSTQYIEGKNLNVYLESIYNHQNYENMFINIFIQIVNAIIYSHSHNVIHLDLNPNNIMIDKYGHCYVIDWGISKSLNQLYLSKVNNIELESSFSISGTLKFMSPEQCTGIYENLCYETDIYLLGNLLYYIFTGKSLITGNNQKELFFRTMYNMIKIEDHDKYGMNIPLEIKRIIKKCCETNVYQRYDSVSRILEDIYKFKYSKAFSLN